MTKLKRTLNVGKSQSFMIEDLSVEEITMVERIQLSTGKLFCIVFLSLLVVNTVALAESEAQEEDFFNMPLDELVEQPYEIVSASRLKQSADKLSVPVTVITADDIHYSGLTEIPDILRFYLGVDVLQFDRNQYGAGVRGLHDTTSDRTLVLVDGRVCNNPAFGGMEWNRLPILVEDIQRIEIVRGPGGAAWGANAFTGVINIIMKEPEDVTGFWGSTTFNDFGDSYSHLRYGHRNDKIAWRASVGYLDRETSDDAGAGDYISGSPALTAIPSMGYSSFQTRDFSRNWYFDTELKYKESESTTWTTGASYSNIHIGDYELTGYFPGRNGLTSWSRFFTRMDHEISDATSVSLQWYGNFYTTHEKVLTDRYATSENDIEAQINHQISDNHNLSFGGNLRYFRLTVDSPSVQSVQLNGEPFEEDWAGLFLVDRYDINERLTLEGQLRTDWYSGTERDWSARGSMLYALDEAGDHTLRLSAAKAYRAPAVGFRKASISRIPLGGPVFAVNYAVPLEDLKNEETWALEAGYHGKLDEDLTLRVDTYYQRFTHLIGGVTTAGVTRLANIDGAKGYGVECEVSKHLKKGQLSAWYSFNGLQTDQSDQSIRSAYPSKNKAGLRFRHSLSYDWMMNVNYSYNDHMETYGNPAWGEIPTNNRLDLTFARPFAKGNGEFMVGVKDVLNKTIAPIFGTGSITAHDTPGRTFFARMQYQF